MPFFHVVIPVYNRGDLMIDAVNSVLSQCFEDFGIILVDDGSTDETKELLDKKFSSHPKIKIIRQENKERGAARNNGFHQANSSYVVFFDSDDYMHNDHLETLHQKINEYNFPDFIATKFYLRKENKIVNSDLAVLSEGYYDYTLFLNGNPLACNICVKRENPNLKLFEEDRTYAIKEDWMFLLQNLRTTKMLLVDHVTITMNDHEDRSMRSDHVSIIKKTILSFDWIKKNVPLNNNELRTLESHINYFCAIHSYIDFRRTQALNYLAKAVRLNGMKKKHVLLFVKTLVGKKFINRLFH